MFPSRCSPISGVSMFTRILAAAAAVLSPCASASAQRYELTVLPLPEGHWGAWLHDMNSQGEIVGVAFPFTSDTTGVLWRDDKLIVLPRLPDESPSVRHTETRHVVWAQGINDDGVIVGQSNSRLLSEQAVMWLDENTVVPVLSRDSSATAINNARVVVGWYAVGPLDVEPFVWDAGKWFSLFPPMKIAYDLNDRNQVIGHNGDGSTAYVWEEGRFSELPPLHSGDQVVPLAINNDGLIGGWSGQASGLFLPVIWSAGRVRELPTLRPGRGAQVRSVNASAEAVGSAAIDAENYAAVLWRHNLATDLNDLLLPFDPGSPDWIVSGHVHINDAAQIAVNARYPGQPGISAARLDPVNGGLTLWGLEPSQPGQCNTIEVRHVTPHGRVSVLWAYERGEPLPLRQCSGAVIDLVDPHLIGSAVADEHGIAFLRIEVPNQTSGLFMLQAVDHTTCEVSPPANAVFRAQ